MNTIIEEKYFLVKIIFSYSFNFIFFIKNSFFYQQHSLLNKE